MTPKTDIPKPPKNLGPQAAAFWRSIAAAYALESHHIELLTAACHQLDRAIEARAILKRDGLTEKDRFGQTREHPAVGIERSCSLAFQRLSRELGLDVEPASALRGPRRPGTRG